MKMIVTAAIMMMISCNTYYKATQLQRDGTAEKALIIDSFQKADKYFILRNGDRSYFMRDAVISNNKKLLNSVLQNPGVDHRLYLMNGANGKKQYNNKIPNERHVLNEVHIYVSPDSLTSPGRPYRLAINHIQKMEVVEKDRKRTNLSTLLGIGVGILGTVGIVTLLVIPAIDISW